MNQFRKTFGAKMIVEFPQYIINSNGDCLFEKYITLNLLETDVLNYVFDGLMKFFLDNEEFWNKLYIEQSLGNYENVDVEGKLAFEDLLIKTIGTKTEELVRKYLCNYMENNCFKYE